MGIEVIRPRLLLGVVIATFCFASFTSCGSGSENCTSVCEAAVADGCGSYVWEVSAATNCPAACASLASTAACTSQFNAMVSTCGAASLKVCESPSCQAAAQAYEECAASAVKTGPSSTPSPGGTSPGSGDQWWCHVESNLCACILGSATSTYSATSCGAVSQCCFQFTDTSGTDGCYCQDIANLSCADTASNMGGVIVDSCPPSNSGGSSSNLDNGLSCSSNSECLSDCCYDDGSGYRCGPTVDCSIYGGRP